MSSEIEQTNHGLAPGKRVVLTIDDVAFGGEGVGRAEDFVVFVPFVMVGESVELEITEVKKRFARARLVRIVTAAPERVQPPCRYFGDCGGCQYQHIDYAAQLRLKHKQITDLLQRIGGFVGSAPEPAVPPPQQYGYRNLIIVCSPSDKCKKRLKNGVISCDNHSLL